MNENKELVFVYGTLLSGEYNNRRLLTESTKLGDADVQGFVMHDLGPFPACRWSTVLDSVVKGEVWEVDKETFQRLDLLEGYPKFYNRVEVQTPFGMAWIYINEKDTIHSPVILSGDWKLHLKGRNHDN